MEKDYGKKRKEKELDEEMIEKQAPYGKKGRNSTGEG